MTLKSFPVVALSLAFLSVPAFAADYSEILQAQSALRGLLGSGQAVKGAEIPAIQGSDLGFTPIPGLSQEPSYAFADKASAGFTLKDADGKSYSLADYKGKYVLLDFFASWCHYCTEAIPLINKAKADFGDKGLVILAVNFQESAEKVREYIKGKGPTYPILLDTDGATARAFRARSFPTFVLVGPDGNVVFTGVGAPGLSQALAKFQATLK